MKRKDALTRTAPPALWTAIQSPEYHQRFVTEVMEGELRVENALDNPAAYYCQEPDGLIELKPGVWGLEITLSKVSVKDGRYFAGALAKMVQIGTETIKATVPRGQKVQLYCVIQTDVPVPGSSSTLFEMREAIWVEGEAEPAA